MVRVKGGGTGAGLQLQLLVPATTLADSVQSTTRNSERRISELTLNSELKWRNGHFYYMGARMSEQIH